MRQSLGRPLYQFCIESKFPWLLLPNDIHSFAGNNSGPSAKLRSGKGKRADRFVFQRDVRRERSARWFRR